MSRIVLNILPSEGYLASVGRLLKREVRRGLSLVYLSVRMPYAQVLDLAKDSSIRPDDVFVIDCSGVKRDSVEEPHNSFFIPSPQSLTALAIAANEVVTGISGPKMVVLDSLSTLLLYNDAAVVAKFSNFMINALRSRDIDFHLLVLDSDAGNPMVKQVESFVDEVNRNAL
jgi:KaiC/GvpD/RAD55 family RecA-like ATPase